MKRKILIILFAIVVIVIGVAAYLIIASSADKTETFLYNPDKHTVVYQIIPDKSGYTKSLAEKDALTRHPDGLIVICEVAGPSINRIIFPPPAERDPYTIYGSNHVLTPIKIKEVIFAGENIGVKTGDIVSIIERYFYVTSETPDYLKIYPEETIITVEYEPMESGKTYLVYIFKRDSEIYNYNGEPILCVSGWRDAVYCLDDTETHQGGEKTPYYDDLFKEALEMYGSYGSRGKGEG